MTISAVAGITLIIVILIAYAVAIGAIAWRRWPEHRVLVMKTASDHKPVFRTLKGPGIGANFCATWLVLMVLALCAPIREFVDTASPSIVIPSLIATFVLVGIICCSIARLALHLGGEIRWRLIERVDATMFLESQPIIEGNLPGDEPGKTCVHTPRDYLDVALATALRLRKANNTTRQEFDDLLNDIARIDDVYNTQFLVMFYSNFKSPI